MSLSCFPKKSRDILDKGIARFAVIAVDFYQGAEFLK